MKRFVGLLLVTYFFYTPSLFAFDEDKCSELFPKSGDAHRPYMSPLYSFTLFPSSTSYVSSFGKCAMYGSTITSEKRKAFIANTYQQISLQAAQGAGEYLEALAYLSGCTPQESRRFTNTLQKNYGNVFRKANAQDAQDVADQIDAFILLDQKLARDCRLMVRL